MTEKRKFFVFSTKAVDILPYIAHQLILSPAYPNGLLCNECMVRSSLVYHIVDLNISKLTPSHRADKNWRRYPSISRHWLRFARFDSEESFMCKSL